MNKKRFEFLLTFEESLVFFFSPTTGHFTLELSGCGILLVAPSFQGLFGVLEGGGLADTLNAGCKGSIRILSGNASGAQLARACSVRTILRNQLLSESRFLFAILSRRVAVAAWFKDAFWLEQALVAVARLGELALGVSLRVFGRLYVFIWKRVFLSRFGFFSLHFPLLILRVLIDLWQWFILIWNKDDYALVSQMNAGTYLLLW